MPSDTEFERISRSKRHLYNPRTRHCRDDGEPLYTNRLIVEDSPYLLQHAHNPVDWYPWGETAFATARERNRPVFLSIGYATCHWCHVMEDECFDDLEVADALNDAFISIKVDREQRPDLDDYYMTALQLTGGQGGWPMSSFLTPDGKPFFGATYLPKATFLNLLDQVRRHWDAQPDALCNSGEKVHQAVQALNPKAGAQGRVDDAIFDTFVQSLLAMEDSRHGGSGQAPKFPHEPQLLLLLDEVQRAGTRAQMHPAWPFLRRVLDAMLRGGIYDQLAGGFHRYATDSAWRVPHFEKMLYNQAQLALVYLRAWLICGDPEYRRILRETLDYLLAEMCSPAGGFYAATDADSEGEEGRCFSWSYDELAVLLAPDDLAFVEALYGVTAAGNFDGRNILHLPQALADQVPGLAGSYRELLTRLDAVRQTLLKARRQRPQPLRDDKEITEWNGMTIIALAEAGRLLAEPRYAEAAGDCALAIWRRAGKPGQLYRNCIHGRPSVAATLADYGYYLQALLALYDCSSEPVWLERAQLLYRELCDHFGDEDGGGFFNAVRGADEPDLGRSKQAMDMTCASGNSATLMAMVLLQQRTGSRQLSQQIRRLEACFADAIGAQPLAYPSMLAALRRHRFGLPATLQYGAGGRIRVEARRGHDGLLSVRLQICDSWHIGSHRADANALVATTLRSLDQFRPLDRIEYPAPLRRVLVKGQPPLAVYEGEVAINAHWPDGDTAMLALDFQACSERECLTPETLQLMLPRRAADGDD
ncbi:MAG: thioredoxin domain-containing protein [Oceanospirillaceae bacterium]|nr:thioredoxin domain-containing protein [Oceanospirillaceae bacterium]